MSRYGDPVARDAEDLVAGVRRGDAARINELIGLIYPELKRRARWLMAGERAGHTFGPSGSELVQRVMEKILSSGGEVFQSIETEEDLINILTRRMRLILVDYSRAVAAQRRPGPRSRVAFEDAQRTAPSFAINIEDVLATEEALVHLEHEDREAARALQLRFFAGLTNEEAARTMGLCVTAFRRALKRATVFVKGVIEAPAHG